MTEQTRAKAGRRTRRSASQLFIAALVVLGVVASVLLLFSENVQWLRVGVMAALWAAIVGAFAMTKYRREAVADQTKAKDLQTVYELQLAREISARREYELGVEARVRSEVQIETSEVAALRAELAHLRNNLQLLFDGNLPTERVALRAEATRMQELGGGRNYDGYQPAPSGLYVPGRTGSPGPDAAASPSGDGDQYSADQYRADDGYGRERAGSVPGLATPYDEPVTAETSVLYPDVPIGTDPPLGYAAEPARVTPSHRPEPRIPGGGRRTPTPPRASGPGRGVEQPADEEISSSTRAENPLESAPQESVSVGTWGDDVPAPDPGPGANHSAYPFSVDPASDPVPAEPPPGESRDVQTPGEPAQAAAADARSEQWDLPDPPRRRRRAEPEEAENSGAHSNGRSVAEIMAGLQSGSAEPTERRHRRRAD